REVTLIDRATVPLSRALGTVAGELVGELHRENGVELRTRRSVQSVDRKAGDRSGPAGPARITLDDGSGLDADLVIAAVGSAPNVEWLRGSGLDLRDGVGCDELGQAAPGVYAIGDVARWGATDGAGVRVEHRTNATEQALAVAQHILHGTRAPAAIPYFWTDQFGERIQVAGYIPAGAHTDVTVGDLSSRRFVLTATQGGVLTGVVAWRMAKDFTRHRAHLAGVG
ncbi:MAG TPA: FAD-dependent oxidoreductase, partial [Beutenbergiaceae bacterium]|nr:FAD-dependent oxidoreductase [Beutenbergiaceae bacterium]